MNLLSCCIIFGYLELTEQGRTKEEMSSAVSALLRKCEETCIVNTRVTLVLVRATIGLPEVRCERGSKYVQ